ncbi:MAG: hypothetical protein WBE44_13725 [Terriglobales bacterium]|jgi:hypothetical protein
MLISRFLTLSLFLAFGTALLAAQSSPGNNSSVHPSADPGQANSSAPAELLSKTVQAFNELDLAQDDSLCYSIRNYKVARDNSQSDSTHAVGYSICQRATRFRMHSAELRVLDSVSR